MVPAHEEEELLPGCLAALRTAERRVRMPVRVIVVLDSCTDRTEAVCRSFGVETVAVSTRNVGCARAAGVARAVSAATDPAVLWLAHTDADSRVGPDWLADQLALADRGADAVLGVVRLPSAATVLHRSHQAAYARSIRPDGTHDHVHGANLGVRASAYLACGGFPPVTAHEDRHLVRRLASVAALSVVYSDRISVETSPRLRGRCPEGFAADLAGLHARPA